jgi:hypothetical protein
MSSGNTLNHPTRFEVLKPYMVEIERGLIDKQSPRAIAKAIGRPGMWGSIRNYKLAVFDLQAEASEAWRHEQAKSHFERLEEGKAEIVDNLEVINLGKLRARQLLATALGEEIELADGTKHPLTLGGAAVYWPQGTKMLAEMIKLEMEIMGDDPESRKANAFQAMTDEELDEHIKDMLKEIFPCGSTRGKAQEDSGGLSLGFC